MKPVLLLTMPFATTTRPAIGLSLLKAALLREGLPCEVSYLNLQFARQLGVENYERISNFDTESLIGEWVFANSMFGQQLPSAERYYNEVLYPCLARSNRELRLGSDPIDAGGLLPGLLELQRQASCFIEDCLAGVAWDDYALVGFTTTFEQNLASLSLARRVKEHFPSIPIVFGGANCEGEMGVTLHRLFPFIDYVCSGEGDIAFPQLARQILHDRPVGDIAGFTRRLDGQTVSSQHSAPVVDMDALPLPNYDDYMVQRSGMSADASLAPQLLIETSRGCWWGEKSHCTFCGLNGLTMKFRVKSADRAFDEIMALVERYPTTRLAAVDNIMDLRYFRDLLPRLVDLGLQLDLFYETKANLRKDQVRLFREAGIGQIQPGIESLNDNVLRLMRKGVSMLQNIQLLRWCAEFMVQPGWNLLAGFPEEDPVDYAMQAQLVPLLTHLPPPIHVNLVRLDRFSPLFDKSGSNGVCNVRAARAHEYVYPFPPEELAALAYFFDFDFADERDPETYLGELRRQVEMWKDEAHRGQLTSLVDGEALVIYDTRPVARNKEYILTGPHRTIYEFFDHAHTRSDLEALLASMPAPVPTQTQIDAILAELVDAKLILQDERRFLSLAVSADYQVHYIASHLERDLPLPANTRYPLNRLYDAQADRVRSLVERELTTIAR